MKIFEKLIQLNETKRKWVSVTITVCIAGILSLWGAAVLTIYTGFLYVQGNLAHVSQVDARDRRRRSAEARQAP